MLDAILVGDLHLDKMNKLYGPIGNRLILEEFDSAIQYAFDSGIPHVIQLGDVAHHSRLSYDAHLQLISLLAKWDEKIHVHLQLGNHDWDESEVHSLQLLKLLSNLGLFRTVHIHTQAVTETIDGVLCNFLAWPATVPPTTNKQPVNFGHFETIGSTGDNGRVLKEGIKTIAKHRYFNGHLHTPHDAGNVHYVGTLYQTSFGETGSKSITHLRAKYQAGSPKLSVKVERIPVNPKMKLHTVVANQRSDLNAVVSDPLQLYRVLTGDDFLVPEAWLAANTNVVKVSGYGNKTELLALQAEEWLPFEGTELEVDYRDVLHDLLTGSYGLSTKRANRALRVLDTVVNSTNKE